MFWAGCVIHKTSTDTYILTQSKFITRNCQLIVHFSKGKALDAQWLIGRERDQFAVLHLRAPHEASTPIQFYHGSLDYSEALCIVPKLPLSFQRFWGRITKPSCASARDDGTVVPNMHFIYNCHHEKTALMISAPVFHKDGCVSGFVVTDCMVKDSAGKVDQHSKICLKAMAVETKLQTLLDSDNWRVNFRFLLILFLKKGMKLTA